MEEHSMKPETENDGEFAGASFPIGQLIRDIISKRRHILLTALIGFCLFLCLGVIRKKKYTAEVVLMPPDAASLSTTSSLSMLTGGPLALGLGGGSGSLLSSRTPGSTIIGILSSRSVEQPIVDQFHLIEYFHSPLPGVARDRLRSATTADEDKKTGLVAINVTLADRVMATEIANAYVTQLNTALTNLNTSSAHKERVFLEERIGSLKSEITKLTLQLSQFSKRTGTINPQLQGQAVYQGLSGVQIEIGEAQAELSALKSTYSEGNIRVRAAEARVASLRSQLNALGGSANTNDSEQSAAEKEPLPSLRQLPGLGAVFTNLSEQLTIQQAVYASLNRQYELSKVEEAKEIPSVRVLDAAITPEKPSSIPAWQLAMLGAIAFGLSATAYWTLLILWRLSSSQPAEESGTTTRATA